MGVKAWQAIEAGADMVVAPTDTRAEISCMLDAFREGRLSEATLNDRCRRILFYKYLIGLPFRQRITDIGSAVAEVGAEAPAVQDSLTNALRRHMSRSPRR